MQDDKTKIDLLELNPHHQTETLIIVQALSERGLKPVN